MWTEPNIPSAPSRIRSSAGSSTKGASEPVGTIFIADDNPAILQGLERALSTHGYRVRTAENGMEMLELMETAREAPDLLLLDVAMPGKTGLEVLEELQDHPRWRQIPVMFITADRDTSLPASVFDRGAIDFLNKPFRLGELLGRIQTHVARNRELRQARAEARAGLRALDLIEEFADIHDRQTLFRTVTGAASDQLGVRRCSVVVIESVRSFGRIASSSDSMDAEGLVLTLSNYPEIQAAVERDEAIWIPDIRESPLFEAPRADWERRGFKAPLHSVAVVPFQLPEGDTAVFITRASGEERTVTAEDAHFARRVAEGMARALRRLGH